MIAFAKMDADACFLQFDEFMDDLVELGIDIVFGAKPEVEKITEYEQIVYGCCSGFQTLSARKLPSLPCLEIG